MLKNILFILSTTLYSCAFSQTPPTSIQPTGNNIVAGYYFVDNNLNKFTGTWRWISGADTVIITLKKLKTTYQAPVVFFQDWLYGCHTYIKNGQLVESSMQFINSTNLSKYELVGSSNYQDSTKADFLFGDLTKRKTLDLTLQFVVGASPNRLIWHTDYRGNRGNSLPGMTLPRDMILIKQ